MRVPTGLRPSLEQIQDQIVDALLSGERVDPAALIAAHPRHAEDLRGLFHVLEHIEAAALRRSAMPVRLGEFRLVREIGRGGMGVVYEAEQQSLRRRVALKVLLPGLGGDTQAAARFRREAETVARLHHRGIVDVYAFGEADGTPYFAMELVEGRSLAAIVAERREAQVAGSPLEEQEQAWRRRAVEICSDVAEALAYAHAKGILHRDVKPANVLIDLDGTPRLSDFGLALDSTAEVITHSGDVSGSPRYMSPEQAFREQPLDGRSDVYSLGVTLYELLTLRSPYPGETRMECLLALALGHVVPPRLVDPGIPDAIDRVLLRALERQPARRCSDAGTFAVELRKALGEWPGAPIRAG